MSVHYKFKSALDFDTITFDGLHISVDDLKKAIVHQKRLGKTADFDLQITNAQTKEEYTDDSTLIPKNTSLIIARIPLARQPKKSWDPSADKQQHIRLQNDPDASNVDLSRMNGSEEDKINAMMVQSTIDYDPNNYQKIRGAQTGEVPINYRCYRCHKSGHWIKNCPMNIPIEMNDVKRNTGIPRSFIDGTQQNETNQPIIVPPPIEKKQEIPEDLICSICKDLFTDAVMIPCCGSSFCDECVRTALIDSEDNECPDCMEKGTSPGSLIPNRFLRNSVNLFKNETGYSKPRPPPKTQPQPVVVEESIESLPQEITTASDDPKTMDNLDETSITNELAEKTTAPADTTTLATAAAAAASADKHLETITTPPHDESDYEDNITVTVPPPHLQSGESFIRDQRHLNGRHGRPGMSSEMESPSKSSQQQIQVHQHSHEERPDTPTIDEKESYGGHSMGNDLMHKQQHSQQQQQHQKGPLLDRPPMQPYGLPAHHMHHNERGMPPEQQYQQAPNSYMTGPPQQRLYDGNYGHPPQNYQPRPYGQHQHGMQRPPYQHRGGYHGGPPMQHHMRPRYMPPEPGSVQSIIQGVEAKIGSGIIDDPLEAFNRIMREKERRKEGRRAAAASADANISPNRRRSRSIEATRRRSPITERRRSPRNRSPDIRRGRSPERRGRSTDRRSTEDRRRKRSNSYDTRASHSFSRSRSRSVRRHSRSPPPQRKRTRSPVLRRSRSRSPSFSLSRSRSRSVSQNRYRAPLHSSRYNARSPPQSSRGSPRNRFRDRRTDRRDDFHRDRDDYRDRSPGYGGYHRGRGSYRGRGRGGHFRYDRPPMSSMQHQQPPPQQQQPPDQYYQQQGPPQSGGSGGYNDGNQYMMPTNRYVQPRGHSPRLAPPPYVHSQQHPPIIPPDTIHYDAEPLPTAPYRARYDDIPPGTEPPPPGFENDPIEHFGGGAGREHESWNIKPLDAERPPPRNIDEYRRTPDPQLQPPQLPYDGGRALTPDLHGRSTDLSHSKRSVSRDHSRNNRDHKSLEKSEKRRRSSKTPPQSHSRDSRREKDAGSRDKHYDKHEKEKKDYEASRSSKHHEKDRTSSGSKDKHRDVEKKHDKDHEKEHKPHKEKRKTAAESSDDEKQRERKAKEKKKKRKEEKALEKKKKKERKEKEKREKELRKEQQRARKLLEAKIEHNVEEDEEEEPDADENEDRETTTPLGHHQQNTQKDESDEHRTDDDEEDDEEEEEEVVAAAASSQQNNSAPKQSPDIKQQTGSDINELKESLKLPSPQSSSPPLSKSNTEPSPQQISNIESVQEQFQPPQIQEPQFQQQHSFTEDDPDMEEGEIYDDLDIGTMTPDKLQDQDEPLDLYADIIDTDSTIINYPDIAADANTKSNLNRKTDDDNVGNSSPQLLNRSDSILDIHANLDFEHEMDDLEPEPPMPTKKTSSSFLPFPEPSKWERDDDMVGVGVDVEKFSGFDDMSPSYNDKTGAGKVTNEVLKRAENAIFAKAINAIRPAIEIKKISIERQKLYANEKSANKDLSPVSSVVIKPKTPPINESHNFQITVPVNSGGLNVERSVEIKSIGHDSKDTTGKSLTIVRSVKDRLGSKVSDLPRSRTQTPPRKIIIENRSNSRSGGGDGGHHRRSRSKEGRSRDDRSKDSGSNDKKHRSNNDSKRSDDSSSKRSSSQKEKDRRDRDRSNDRSSRNKSKDRDKGSRDHRKSPVHLPPPMAHGRNREREQERARELARNREKERMKQFNATTKPSVDSSSLAMDDKQKESSQNKDEKKRERSPSSADKKDKRDKRQKKDEKSIKSTDDRNKKDEKSVNKSDAQSTKSSNYTFERKRSTVDESNFVPDYDDENVIGGDTEINKKSGDCDTESTKSNQQTAPTKDDKLTAKSTKIEKKKRRSQSVSSSSSSDSYTSDSSSDSDDKRRKKRKHKKQKKSKRAAASSSDSDSSPKKKKSKRKKSKKKKKTKK